MTLRDDVEKAFERVKAKLKAEQARKVISSSVMPFEYANGRVMFDSKKTIELVRDYAIVRGDARSVLAMIANEMRELDLPKALTVGYARTIAMSYVFVFVYLRD